MYYNVRLQQAINLGRNGSEKIQVKWLAPCPALGYTRRASLHSGCCAHTQLLSQSSWAPADPWGTVTTVSGRVWSVLNSKSLGCWPYRWGTQGKLRGKEYHCQLAVTPRAPCWGLYFSYPSTWGGAGDSVFTLGWSDWSLARFCQSLAYTHIRIYIYRVTWWSLHEGRWPR